MPGGAMAALEADSDLVALAEARAKARDARAAFESFDGATQAVVDRIVSAMANAGAAAAEELARLTVEETGYGVVADKVYKNLYNARFVAQAMLEMRTLGVLWVDEPNRMAAVGSPMGVLAAIIPVTNPTSTVLFKCLAAVKSGNAIVCAPHPRAVRCCARTAEIMARAGERRSWRTLDRRVGQIAHYLRFGLGLQPGDRVMGAAGWGAARPDLVSGERYARVDAGVDAPSGRLDGPGNRRRRHGARCLFFW